jgi:hypothetical protein
MGQGFPTAKKDTEAAPLSFQEPLSKEKQERHFFSVRFALERLRNRAAYDLSQKRRPCENDHETEDQREQKKNQLMPDEKFALSRRPSPGEQKYHDQSAQ